MVLQNDAMCFGRACLPLLAWFAACGLAGDALAAASPPPEQQQEKSERTENAEARKGENAKDPERQAKSDQAEGERKSTREAEREQSKPSEEQKDEKKAESADADADEPRGADEQGDEQGDEQAPELDKASEGAREAAGQDSLDGLGLAEDAASGAAGTSRRSEQLAGPSSVGESKALSEQLQAQPGRAVSGASAAATASNLLDDAEASAPEQPSRESDSAAESEDDAPPEADSPEAAEDGASEREESQAPPEGDEQQEGDSPAPGATADRDEPPAAADRGEGESRGPTPAMVGSLEPEQPEDREAQPSAAVSTLTGSLEPRVTQGVLAQGTRWETGYFSLDSRRDGPTVVIISGMHGDELAGPLAAERLRSIEVCAGSLHVLPQANVPAIEVGERRTPEAEHNDLNRNFPRSPDDVPRGEMATRLWEWVEALAPDVLLDLHEGVNYHAKTGRSVGNTILFVANERSRYLAMRMVVAANRLEPNYDQRFRPWKPPVIGGIARAASDQLGAIGMILETTRKGPLERRVEQHWTMVTTLLEDMDMIGRVCEMPLPEPSTLAAED